jgi:cytochrome c peroxidase
MMPSHPARRAAAERGERLFASVGCTTCHVPELILDRPVFTDPGPYNPPGNLRPADVQRFASLDLTKETLGPHLETLPDGRAVVRAYTDLKRHDLNDDDYQHFANEKVAQGTLAARVPGSAFTQSPRPRPTRQFLTKRLWDVGNTDPYGHRGDLSTMTEAIHFHGGEARAVRDAYFALPEEDRAAIIEFLKTLQILPEGSPRVVTEGAAAGPPVQKAGTAATARQSSRAGG